LEKKILKMKVAELGKVILLFCDMMVGGFELNKIKQFIEVEHSVLEL